MIRILNDYFYLNYIYFYLLFIFMISFSLDCSFWTCYLIYRFTRYIQFWVSYYLVVNIFLRISFFYYSFLLLNKLHRIIRGGMNELMSEWLKLLLFEVWIQARDGRELRTDEVSFWQIKRRKRFRSFFDEKCLSASSLYSFYCGFELIVLSLIRKRHKVREHNKLLSLKPMMLL